jgi:hypothetical protein
MTSRKQIERGWLWSTAALVLLALVCAVLMLVTGHDQGVHDTTFGLALFMGLLLGGEGAITLAILFGIYKLVLHLVRLLK